MAVHKMDYRGLKCPLPTIKLTSAILKVPKGDILEVTADCPSFENDLKGFTQRTHTTVLWIRDQGAFKVCQIRR